MNGYEYFEFCGCDGCEKMDNPDVPRGGMMDGQNDVHSLRDHRDELLAMADEISEAVNKVVAEMADAVEELARQSIEGGVKSGFVRQRGDEFHQASAAGEPPASDSGYLAASLVVRADEETAGDVGISDQACCS